MNFGPRAGDPEGTGYSHMAYTHYIGNTGSSTYRVDANLDDIKDEEMLKTHRDLTRPEGSRGIANTKGHIGFLGHGARVEFRNIRIKELAGSAKK